MVVCLDTVRFDVFWLPETLHHADALTPWLERALVLERTQATSPWTVPSVASALTGSYPPRHGAGFFEHAVANLDEHVPSALVDDAVTLPETLAAAGFETRAFVAHPWFKSGYGLDRGFGKLSLIAGREDLTRSSIEWLERGRSKDPSTGRRLPFLLYLHYMEAHGARRLRGEKLQATLDGLPPELKGEALAKAPGASCEQPDSRPCQRYLAYLGAVLELRDSVATMLAALRRLGLADDTLVALYSDHGEELHDHLEQEKARGADPRGVYGVGHGHSLYQEQLHVPVVIWHPDRPAGRVTRLTSLIDLVPSLLAWLAVPTPPVDWQGVTIDSLLLEPPPSGRGRHVFSSGIAYGPEQLAIRFDDWKRIRYLPGESELYQLADDPTETEPTESPTIAEGLDRGLDRYLAKASRRGMGPELSAQDLERLQSLGYLGDVEPPR